MKHILYTLIIVAGCMVYAPAGAQYFYMEVDGAEELIEEIAGDGVTLFNPKIECKVKYKAMEPRFGVFAGDGDLGLNNGVALTTAHGLHHTFLDKNSIF